jgi:hypothetical protein
LSGAAASLLHDKMMHAIELLVSRVALILRNELAASA